MFTNFNSGEGIGDVPIEYYQDVILPAELGNSYGTAIQGDNCFTAALSSDETKTIIRHYQWDGSTWAFQTQYDEILAGMDPIAVDIGSGVAISSDGTQFVLMHRYNDGTIKTRLRVIEETTPGVWVQSAFDANSVTTVSRKGGVAISGEWLVAQDQVFRDTGSWGFHSTLSTTYTRIAFGNGSDLYGIYLNTTPEPDKLQIDRLQFNSTVFAVVDTGDVGVTDSGGNELIPEQFYYLGNDSGTEVFCVGDDASSQNVYFYAIGYASPTCSRYNVNDGYPNEWRPWLTLNTLCRAKHPSEGNPVDWTVGYSVNSSDQIVAAVRQRRTNYSFGVISYEGTGDWVVIADGSYISWRDIPRAAKPAQP